jgi:hypothetical protein
MTVRRSRSISGPRFGANSPLPAQELSCGADPEGVSAESDRRLGTRYHVDPLPITWTRALDAVKPRRFRKKRSPDGTNHVGVLVNVSVTGAALLCASEGDRFAEGEPVRVMIDDSVCNSVARWEHPISPADAADLCPDPSVLTTTFESLDLRIVGVEFGIENHAFEILIDRLIGAFRPRTVGSHRHQCVDADPDLPAAVNPD